MRLAPIRERLIATVPAFKGVRGAGDLAVAIAREQFSEMAFVSLLSQKGADNSLGHGAHSQEITARFSVAYWVRNLSDSEGAAAYDQSCDLREAVIEALAGWTPDAQNIAPANYNGSTLLRFAESGAQLWSEQFSMTYLYRSNP